MVRLVNLVRKSGYSSGGRVPASVDTIEKFPFAADANATDVGDLTQSRGPCSRSTSLKRY